MRIIFRRNNIFYYGTKFIYFRKEKFMEKYINELLTEEMAEQIKAISDMTSGTDEKSSAVDDVVALLKVQNEAMKLEAEANHREQELAMEAAFKERELAERKKDRITKICIEGGIGVAWLLVYTGLSSIGYHLEATGNANLSGTFRDVQSIFRRKK